MSSRLLRSWTVSLMFVAASALNVSAQSAPSAWTAQELADMQKIQAAALNSNYGYEQLSYLTDSIGPRLTGSPQHQAAVDYVASEMRKLGLTVTLEKVTVPRWVRGEENGELVSYPGQPGDSRQKIVLTALGHSVATPAEGLTADVVVVHDFAEMHALGAPVVRGKIVLFNNPYDERLRDAGYSFEGYGDAVKYRTTGAMEAAKLGAAAVLVRSVGTANDRLPHTGLTVYDPKGTSIPAAAVTTEDADLLERLSKRGAVRMMLTLLTQSLAPVTGYNVIADLKGSVDPDHYVIVSGHLDSWDLGTGAIDDGAGVAMAMQAVQAILQLGLHPKRTIRFVGWLDEEGGITGALQYPKDFPAAQHFATIECDTGAGHPIGFVTDSTPDALTTLQPIAPILEHQGAVVTRTADEVGADISILSIAGVPGFAPIMDSRKYFDYHHTAADTLDKVDPRELRENSALVSVLAYALATMSQPLPRHPKPAPDWMK